MAINIFEGARRIAKVVAALWVVGAAAFTLFQGEPYITANYIVTMPDLRPARVEKNLCKPEAAQEWVNVITKNGAEAHITLCFQAQKFDDGKMLVPYRIDKDGKRMWGNSQYSSDVKKYTSEVKNTFTLTKEDENWLDEKRRSEQWWQRLIGVFWLTGGFAFLWGLTWVIGWVARGFMGIPHGEDRREEK